MSDIKTDTKLHFSNLDAIRSLACLSVFTAHSFDYLNFRKLALPLEQFTYNHFINGAGPTGVSLFFVLSGFLITCLLMKEKKELGTIRLKRFYTKRILRIWPMFFLVVALAFFVIPAVTHSFNSPAVKQHLPWFLFFGNNFDRLHSGFTGFGNDAPGILWSVAVEEQFYLVWPVLLLLLPSKYYGWLFAIVIAGSACFRLFFIHEPSILLYHTFSVMGDLAIGACAALLTIGRTGMKKLLSSHPFLSLVGIVAFVTAFAFHNFLLDGNRSGAAGRLLLSLAFGFFILCQANAESGPFRLSRFRLLGRFGSITYGFYCLHLFVIMLIQKLNHQHTWPHEAWLFYSEFIAAFLITSLISLASFRYFEGVFLRLKNKFN